jgi:hypothetical protein
MKRLALLLLNAVSALYAQNFDTNNVSVQTFVGSGFAGSIDGVGTLTMFRQMSGVVADRHGTLFVLDYDRVRKVSETGEVTTFAGGGNQLWPSSGTNAFIGFPTSIAIDRSDVIWLTNSDGVLVRITPLAQVSAQSVRAFGGIAFDSANRAYGTDTLGQRIYRLETNGVWEVFAGSGSGGAADGNGIFSSFDNPGPIAIDSADNVYVCDIYRVIRRISPNRDVVTFAGQSSGVIADGVGTNAVLGQVRGMHVTELGDIIVCSGTAVRRISPQGKVTTVAGSFFEGGYENGFGNMARFSGANGVCEYGSKLFVADAENFRVRMIAFDQPQQPVIEPRVEIALFPGVRISGIVGRAYRIESSVDSNQWEIEETILLSKTPLLWIDQNPVGPMRFYRAMLLP